jgi:protein-L-isoaspartate(D-aspartate) O-methyltransferase
MIIPVGERRAQQLYLLEKKEGRIIQKSILPVLFVPMIDKEGRTY